MPTPCTCVRGPGRSGVSPTEFALGPRMSFLQTAGNAQRGTTGPRGLRPRSLDPITQSVVQYNEADGAPGHSAASSVEEPTPLLRYGCPATLTGTELLVVVPVPSWP